MDITITQEETRVPVTVFRIKGELTAETQAQLLRQALLAHEAGMRYLLLDLDQADFISSSGLRAIHQIYSMLRADSSEEGNAAVRSGIRSGSYHSSHLKLLNPKPNVMQVLQAAGFDMFLDIYDDRLQALAAF
jgi:anti-anti-sigma factor